MNCDFLVIGSGIAGLSFALKASNLGDVVVITKKRQVDTATNLAQGGIAAVLSEDDSIELHVQDTLSSGAGLCNQEIVEMVVKNGPDRVEELRQMGVEFINESNDKTKFDLGKEGGHSRRRVAHAMDLTGKEIERALINQVEKKKNITVFENKVAVDLLIDEKNKDNKCLGAYILEDNKIVSYRAKLTVLCTGGTGKVYLYTTNPDIATGDGIAMAFRAGATLSNMEFVQFHPTCLYSSKAKNFLISEAVRGEGGILIDKNKNSFMARYDDKKDLATRDTVARAIDKEMKEKGEDCVYLDVSFKDEKFLKKRFPTIYQKCLSLGIDITSEPIPVVPAAHYMCGGVRTDKNGLTSVKNLMVLGESACTGLHGGNRLASNSLLEAVVFSDRAFNYCKDNSDEILSSGDDPVDDWSCGNARDMKEEVLISHNWDQIRRIMWNYVGIVRSSQRLGLAEERLEEIAKEVENHYRRFTVTPNMIELRNITLIALLIVQSAKLRKESRGLHYIVDYPNKSEYFRDEIKIKRDITSYSPWKITITK